MATKFKNFYAYQIDFHYQDVTHRNEVDAIKWDERIAEEIFNHIFSLTPTAKTKKYRDSWLMYLDYLDSDEHFIFGRFSSAVYGTTGELVHADNLSLRPNPKQPREGETESTYFLVRKADGLLLLQGNIRLNRPKLDEYLEQLGNPVILSNNLTFIQVCTLVDNTFFDSIRALNTVNKIEIEVTTVEAAADESDAVRALRNDAEEVQATDVQIKFEAKYQRSGLSGALSLVKKYKDQQGVNKIVVRGKLAGAEKVIKLDESQEKYSVKVEVDTNVQPMLSSVETALKHIVGQRSILRR
jgi:hypothetical protein